MTKCRCKEDDAKDISLFLLLEWFRSHLEHSVTKDDLKNLQSNITMKLAELKAQLVAAAAANTEAFAEISAKIVDLQTQLATAIEAATNPDVTDEETIAALNTVSATAQELADIVPNTPPVEPPAEEPTV
jgi:hypothetical protein